MGPDMIEIRNAAASKLLIRSTTKGAGMDLDTTALLTDLYQLNMLQAYLERGVTKTAVFEFFVRKLPARRDFLLSAGLEQALDFLEAVLFSKEEIDWLARSGRFSNQLIEYLAGFRFTGEVHAMHEGTAFLPTNLYCV